MGAGAAARGGAGMTDGRGGVGAGGPGSAGESATGDSQARITSMLSVWGGGAGWLTHRTPAIGSAAAWTAVDSNNAVPPGQNRRVDRLKRS